MGPALDATLALTTRLIGLACLLQTVEFFQIRDAWADTGVWRWAVLRDDLAGFPRWVRAILDSLLAPRGFHIVLALRLAAAMLALGTGGGASAPVLFATSVLVCLRWRGAFNGGSDYMTLLVLGALTAAWAFPGQPLVRLGAVLHVGLQCGLSYFIAGVVKLRGRRWRNGTALTEFLAAPRYGVPRSLEALTHRPFWALAVSWAVILPECAFPAAYLSPSVCAPFLVAAAAFHLFNVYLFGLNRFFLAWAASWPSVYFLSEFMGLP